MNDTPDAVHLEVPEPIAVPENGSSGDRERVIKVTPKKFRQEELCNMLMPLSKEELVVKLAKGCSLYDSLYEETVTSLEEHPRNRRLMIRNISYLTTDECYLETFSKYGEVEDAVIVRSKQGRSKGFGFATFKEISSVTRVLQETISLDGRDLIVRLASEFLNHHQDDEQPQNSTVNDSGPLRDSIACYNGGSFCTENGGGVLGNRKVFVRNLSKNTTKESLVAAFTPFGCIEDCVIVTDAVAKSTRYAFVVFSKREEAAYAAQQTQRIIDGRLTFVRLADKLPPAQGQYRFLGTSPGYHGKYPPPGITRNDRQYSPFVVSTDNSAPVQQPYCQFQHSQEGYTSSLAFGGRVGERKRNSARGSREISRCKTTTTI